MEKATKLKIKTIVKDYIEMFPEEFCLAVRQIKRNRDNQRTKFAELKKTDFVERGLIEVPQTLNSMFYSQLTEDEMEELRTKKGIRWFANTFPVFKLAEKI